jgi:hypothetical protein
MSLSGTSWSKRYLDETHECTINKDVKAVVRNLSYDKINTQLHYIPFRAFAHNNFLQLFSGKEDTHMQGKDSHAYENGVEKNVKAYMGKLNNSTLFNIDFDKCNGQDKTIILLQHIFSGSFASQDIRDSLLSLKATGDERTEQHIKCFITHESSLRKGQKRAYIFTKLKKMVQKKRKLALRLIWQRYIELTLIFLVDSLIGATVIKYHLMI